MKQQFKKAPLASPIEKRATQNSRVGKLIAAGLGVLRRQKQEDGHQDQPGLGYIVRTRVQNAKTYNYK